MCPNLNRQESSGRVNFCQLLNNCHRIYLVQSLKDFSSPRLWAEVKMRSVVFVGDRVASIIQFICDYSRSVHSSFANPVPVNEIPVEAELWTTLPICLHASSWADSGAIIVLAWFYVNISEVSALYWMTKCWKSNVETPFQKVAFFCLPYYKKRWSFHGKKY